VRCRHAMRALIIESDLPRGCFTLADILEFRTSGCEFQFTPLMVAIQVGYCRNTARRHIDILVRHGVLTKVATAANESGRSGTYLLHTEKLVVRPELQRYREAHGIHLATGTGPD
jgi:hypothetical protein